MNSNNIYPSFEMDSEQHQYIKLKFVILEKDWPYPNFEIVVAYNDPLMFINKELQDRHGGITDIRLYLDAEKQNQQVIDYIRLQQIFNKKIGDALAIKGSNSQETAPNVTIYYDFKNATKSPVQLF
ncbi:unnamed protein product (macronuclear) [Paramecium tetraurelia]|uniref:Uncharacterized protein n=1 Tax=Paramecium tetraurelia TaxID=5888 RepID=A0DUJ7_PARTE|nr:uncharacterized protein GSPATT00020386001 [Paramecium tetraurelia]CAK86714.1 unnamed protein product [Paramecium tetraurelia]|eukprot:XP_001454111.1 hypothetical protein (macronuclear) [Paramecium tetraurelia strain d4-2]